MARTRPIPSLSIRACGLLRFIPQTDRLYPDDLYVGQRFKSGTCVMQVEWIKEFAAEFDPRPFRLNEAAAEASVFKGLAAGGWHTASLAMRLLVSGGLPLASGIVGLGGEFVWPKPTRPGRPGAWKARLSRARRRAPNPTRAS